MPPEPFSRDDHAARMARAARDARTLGLTGLLITPGPDLAWLCGHHPPETTGHPLTLLVLTPDHEPRLLVPAATDTTPATVRVTEWRPGQDPYAVAAGLLIPHGHYGVSDTAPALHLLGLQEALPLTTYRPLTAVLPLLRAAKDAHELARLAAAAAAADAAYEEILAVRFAGRRESEVAADLARLLREHGHSEVGRTAVASGPNGADPQHGSGERVIREGDTVVLEFGGLKDGYGSDTARTVHVGPPTEEESAVHEVVRRAQRAAFEAVRPGVACQEIDRVARTVVAEAGYGPYGVPRTGHGVGMTRDEPPYLAAGEAARLMAGMCFSIEPGIGLPGRFGVRIEDVVACTADGAVALNRADRSLTVVA